MGIDIKSGGRRVGHNIRKAPVSKNVYIKLLEKLYRYAAVIRKARIISICVLFCSNSNCFHTINFVLVFSFIARRADSKFAATIVKRLRMSRINNPPISISRLARYLKGKESKIAVIVGAVTNDSRLLEVPQLTIAALRFTETARARIVKAGGECLTFDQLALRSPKGSFSVNNINQAIPDFRYS